MRRRWSLNEGEEEGMQEEQDAVNLSTGAVPAGALSALFGAWGEEAAMYATK